LERLLQFFRAERFPENVRHIAQPFCALAFDMAKTLPVNAEGIAALRKLMESLDCAIRAKQYREPNGKDLREK
jgi:hypothetical protein